MERPDDSPQPDKPQVEPDKETEENTREINLINSRILLVEAQGRRDKPEKLTQREEAVTQGETLLIAGNEQLEINREALAEGEVRVDKKKADCDAYIEGYRHLKSKVATLESSKTLIEGLIMEAVDQVDYLQKTYRCFSQANLPSNPLLDIRLKLIGYLK